ncbi:MAG: DNA recombination protein RmuC [Actinomycetales bacterium]|nr:DNA recombination protein RmuC [Actinomycetales bacterium]
MDLILVLALGLVAGLAVGFALGWLLKARASAGIVFEDLAPRLAAAEATVVAKDAQIFSLEQRNRELGDESRRRTDEEAERARQEHKVLEALAPVKETLRSMQTKVSELEQQRSLQYGALEQQLKESRQFGEELRATTQSLASALSSNSVRGTWGEAQLRRLVEVAGLTAHVDFDTQQTMTTDTGVIRPDMIINLPGGKTIVIDAKVPFNSYLEASQIPLTATGEQAARRETLLKAHVKAVRAHVDALSGKNYWTGFDFSPEFVLAFIPSESLLASALEADPTLLDYAFSKRVALASPVNLWAVLKTVAYTWQQQVVTDEAKKLFDLGNELYSRLATMTKHSEDLRKAIENTVKHYNGFIGALETRVLTTARKFPGIDPTKIIAASAEIHEAPRPITAAELVDPDLTA